MEDILEAISDDSFSSKSSVSKSKLAVDARKEAEKIKQIEEKEKIRKEAEKIKEIEEKEKIRKEKEEENKRQKELLRN